MANPPPPGCHASAHAERPGRRARGLLVVAVLAALPLATVPSAGAQPATPVPADAPAMASLPGVEVPIYANLSPTPTPRAPVPAGAGGATTAAGPGTVNGGPPATINVTYDAGFNANPAAKAAFQAAVDIWAAKLSSPVPISVDAKFTTSSCGNQPFGPNTLGSAGPRNFLTNFTNAPLPNVYYPVALANSLAGSDLSPDFDLCASFNSNFNTGSNVFYFGTDGNPPFDDYDFMSVVLHELGHGLGFVGSMRPFQFDATQGDCCFNGRPFAYDVQTFTGDGATLLSRPHPSVALLTALTSGNVFFRGPLTNAAAGSGGAKLFAPGTFQSGSSYSHLDETLYQPAGGNALMTPSINNDEVEHDPGPITLAMFADMGWQLAVDAPGPPRNVSGTAGNGQVAVTWQAPLSNGGSTITSYTVTSSPEGKTCTTSGLLTCTVTGLTNGTPYTFTVRAQNVGGLGTVSTPSAAITPRTTPGAPTNLVASSGNSQGTITWMAPASNGGAPITGYTVTASPDGATCTWTSGPLTCTVTGLSNGTSYTFTARAQNSAGLGATSSASNAIVPGAVGAPGAPTGATATVVKQTATVSWTAPASPGSTPITSYVVTSTPGSKTCTWTSGPLQCNVTGLDAGVSHTFTVRAYNSAGPGSASAASNAVVPWSGSFFHPLDPTRILDSRNTLGGFGNNTPLGSGAGNVKTLDVTTGAVPSTASAVVLNVTATSPTANSFLTLFPTGAPLPNSSNLNFGVGQTIPNLVTVQVGGDGTVSFFNAQGTVHVIADIVGYYDDDVPVADRFTALDPQRILDSRAPAGTTFTGKLDAATPQSLDIRGLASVPDTATAIVANITATDASQNSFLTVYPGPTVPGVSNLNFAAGQTIPNLAVVKLGANGTITFKNATGAVHVVVDLVGYFDPTAGSLFHPGAPVRMLDSRFGPGFTSPPGLGGVTSAQAKSLLVAGTPTVPAGASAVVMNTTVTGATLPSFLSVFPGGTPLPNVSNLNFAGGQTIPNLVSVKIGANNMVSFANAQGSTDVIADVVGYYAAG